MGPGSRTAKILIPLFFYAGFVGLYAASFTEVWVYRKAFMDVLVKDAWITGYAKLYWPVVGLGAVLAIEFLVLIWKKWTRTVMYLTHVLLGLCSLAFSASVWADVDKDFNVFYSESWFKSGAEMGPGFLLFFASGFFLILAGISALAASTGKAR